jgi:hypothetical protein
LKTMAFMKVLWFFGLAQAKIARGLFSEWKEKATQLGES